MASKQSILKDTTPSTSASKAAPTATATQGAEPDARAAAALAKKRAKAKAKKARQRANRKKKKLRPPFVASVKYDGHREGYFFSNGKEGAGYYLDTQPTAPKKPIATTAPPAINRARRAGAGVGRGHGLFTTTAVKSGEVIVRARPALSTIFDQHSHAVCAFCFRTAPLGGWETEKVTLQKDSDGRLGVFVVDKVAPAVNAAIFNGFAENSINAGSSLEKGDIIESVNGVDIGTLPGALQRCIEALGGAPKGETGFSVRVRRKFMRQCQKCLRCAVCKFCCAAGRREWHESSECVDFCRLPPAATKGETSPIRMMLRYRAIDAVGDWTATVQLPAMFGGGGDASNVESQKGRGDKQASVVGDKEPLSLVSTLQFNEDVLSSAQKLGFSRAAGVPPAIVAQVVVRAF